ncbi:InlB B-repeat-containing protein [Cohnella suwonensis]|uniref:InlB B-repeat-containing protein n=1 Tax=Cohnella suwonensis TaxID=696072 RepID=A0ABW0LWX4_9BACL
MILFITAGSLPSYSSAASVDNFLSGLTISGGTAVEDPFEIIASSYYADVVNEVSEITVTPTARHSGAKIKVNGAEVASDSASEAIALDVGVNTINILVTAEDERTQRTYTLTVTRAGLAGSDAKLSFLGVYTEDLRPFATGFHPSLPNFDIGSSVSISRLLVRPETSDSAATVTINGKPALKNKENPVDLHLGKNTITVTVTAQDGGTTRTYTVQYVRGATSDADLEAVMILDRETGRNPEDSTQFLTSVTSEVDSITVTPKPKGKLAAVKVNGITLPSGGASEPIALNFGSNTVSIDVISEDGTSQATYTLTVKKLYPRVFFFPQDGNPYWTVTDIIPGTKVSEPVITREGYGLLGWYTDQEYTEQWNFAADTVDMDVMLFAKWGKAYTVTFDAQGGSGSSANLSVVVQGPIRAPVPPVKAGFTFGGWYTDASTVTPWYFETDSVDGDMTLYAKWTAGESYSVIFDSQGGPSIAGLTGVSPGEKIRMPAPTRDGYRLAGWYREPGFATAWNTASDTVNADLTLYAKWDPLYTVTFDTREGSYIPPVVTTYGTIKPYSPSKSNYIFTGWYKDAELTSLWNFSSEPVSSNMTVYAGWFSAPGYTATFNTNGGNSLEPATLLYPGAKIPKPLDPWRSSEYVFDGWYKEPTFETLWNFAADTVNGDTTLYAKWKDSTHSVTFNTTGGYFEDGFPTRLINIARGTKVERPPNPVHRDEDVVFDGWYKEAALLTPWNFETDTVKGNTDLYAKWIRMFTVYFDLGDGSEVATQRVAAESKITKLADPVMENYTFKGWYVKDHGMWDFDSNTVEGNTVLYADWEYITYTLTFDYQDGGEPVVDTIYSGDTVYQPEDPDREGYTFQGWYADASYTKPWDFLNDTVTENVTLYAKWDPIMFTLTFDTQGGSPVDSQTVRYGKKGVEPPEPTKAGYRFDWWYSDQEFNLPWEPERGIYEDVTMYAKWMPIPAATYTVTYDSQGGSAVASLTGITSGATVTKPADPTRAGYTFSGWYKDEGYASAWNFMTDTVSTNTMLYAKWTSIPVSTYTVTFDSKDGSAVASAPGIVSGATVTKPADPTRAGYTFSGWYKDEGYASAWNFMTDTVSANTTLYAKWTSIPVSTYTVTFDSKEGSAVASATGIVSGATVTKPADPTRAGYTFSGWYKDEGYASAWNFSTDMVSANTSLYAKWTAVPVSTYTVTFDSKEGSAVASATGIVSGATVTKPADPTRAGYTFSGWYKDEGYASAWNFMTDTVSTNTTLYAKWTAVPVSTYTVTFDSKDGSAVASATGIVSGATVTKPADPTRAGYTFSGWYKDEGYATAWNFMTDTVSTNTTLYAKWTVVPVSTYTVTFDSKEGSAVASATGIVSGATVTKPTDPTRAGYTFSGWYKDEGYVSAWNFSTDTVSANTTLYAKWTAVPVSTYTVTFDSKEGSAVASATGIVSGATVTKPADPTRAGYTFSGWYKDEGYATAWNFITDTVSANTTLYAKWTEVPSGGGSSGGSSGGVSVPDNSPVISDDGELTLPVGRPGTVSSSDDEITIEIPADATDASLQVTVETLLDTNELLKHNEVLVSEIFEVLKNVPGTFKKNITLKLAFDPTKLSDGQRASIFYYDEEKKEWMEVGGIVSGEFITAEVNHFTKFAVLAVGEPAVEFIDIAGHWAEEAIRQGASQEITAGYPDGTFKPNLTVTRAQFAVMLMNAIKPAGATEELAFKDASQIPAWAKNAVAEAKQAGIITGYDDGTFRPNAEVTRVEMAAMIVKALDLTVEVNAATGFADNSEIPAWAKGAVAALTETGLMQGTGDNRFNSEAKASRAEAVTVLLRMLEQQKTKK